MPRIRHVAQASRWSRPVAVVAVLLAAWLSWLALRAMCLAVFAERDPQIVAQLRPLSSVSLLHQAFSLPKGAPAAVDLLARVARLEPIAPEPFIAAADRARERENLAVALKFLEAARLRAPRDAAIHLRLLELYTRTGAVVPAINSADRAMRLSPRRDVVSQLGSAISGFASTPAGRVALAQALARGPRWRGYFVRSRQAVANDPELVFRLIEQESQRDPDVIRRSEQASFLNTLIERGEYDMARLAFLNFLPPAFAGTGAVYDDGFRAQPGPQPFNWRLISGGAGAGSIRFDDDGNDGYLLAETTGRRGPAFARQTVTLAPGRYVLRTRIRRIAGEGAGPAWALGCLRPVSALAALPLMPTGNDWSEAAVTFDVPAGCGAQRLSLGATEYTGENSIAVDWVRIAPVRRQ